LSIYVELHGRGLHGGEPAKLRLDPRPGPLLFQLGPDTASLGELEVVRADHGVKVRARDGTHEVDLFEHLLAALAGMSIRSGLTLSVEGPEVPLLDGGAHELARAIAMLGLRREATRLCVARAGELEIGTSRYRFEPGPRPQLRVEVDYGFGREVAEHGGSEREFLERIAPARTFGFERDALDLRAAGRARHVDPAAVLVLDATGRTLPPCRPAGEAELARHKLLDWMGDLFLFGGPPRGRVEAWRPGHAANHEMAKQALACGLLAEE